MATGFFSPSAMSSSFFASSHGIEDDFSCGMAPDTPDIADGFSCGIANGFTDGFLFGIAAGFLLSWESSSSKLISLGA